ncbi:MAG: transposase [Myxococcota bacterium]
MYVVVDVAEQLPDTVEALRALLLRRTDELEERDTTLRERDAELEARDAEIAQLREYVRLLRHQRFGRKSEKVCPDQLSIFNEAEREVAEAAAR